MTGAEDYRRGLSLDDAAATTTYRAGGVTYTRELISSPADDVILMRLAADRPGALAFHLTLESPQQGAMLPPGSDWIGFAGKGPDAHGIAGVLRFAVKARVLAQDGSVEVSEDGIRVQGASEAIVAINAATSFVRFDQTDGDAMARVDTGLMELSAGGWADLRARHVAEHRRLFGGFSIDLGTGAAEELPTDERIAGFAAGGRSGAGGAPMFSMAAISWCRRRVRGHSRPICRASGTRRSSRPGTASTRPTSTCR